VAVADEIQADALSLPSSTGLSADDRTRVIGALRALARSGGP
jgi:dTDP-4-amino-4,6-dideoxygalactose transaminase